MTKPRHEASVGVLPARRQLHRRSILRALAASAITLPLTGLFEKSAKGGVLTTPAKRFIVVYFPDGIPEPPGGPSKWYASGQGSNVTLSTCLQPLAPYLSSCCFFRNLSMGPTDSGSHPGGAKKLLTATDGGNGISLDRHLASTIGASMPFRHVYLGAMALQNNATGDKFVSYVAPGTTVGPEDDPVKAFTNLFGGGQSTQQVAGPNAGSILDDALSDLGDLEAQLGDVEKTKLDLHVQALRDTEKRIQSLANETPACNQAIASVSSIDETRLYDAAQFPDVLKAQMDVMVQAMACGLTSVGVLQLSEHTSELIMSRFPNTQMYDPNYDMRSHQASHYGVSSDPKFASYVLQRTWIVQQLAYLLSQLAARPEGSGSMLDDTIVLLCSEIADGNTHSHDDMGFVLAGGSNALRTGKLYDFGYRRHADLLLTIGNALGDTMTSFGDSSSGPLPGLLAT